MLPATLVQQRSTRQWRSVDDARSRDSSFAL
jgi:hypothetical protein